MVTSRAIGRLEAAVLLLPRLRGRPVREQRQRREPRAAALLIAEALPLEVGELQHHWVLSADLVLPEPGQEQRRLVKGVEVLDAHHDLPGRLPAGAKVAPGRGIRRQDLVKEVILRAVASVVVTACHRSRTGLRPRAVQLRAGR